MRSQILKPLFLFIAVICLPLSGCVSVEQQAANRTAQLRQVYPPGMLRTEVQAKWGNIRPDFTLSRPNQGWGSHTNQFIATKLGIREASLGKPIQLVERYWGPDGLFSLAYCWYFYDADEKILDVEWQYMSD